LREIALHGGVECYIEGCWVGCVGWLMCCMGHFVGFWARIAAHVVFYRLDMEMGTGGALNGLFGR